MSDAIQVCRVCDQAKTLAMFSFRDKAKSRYHVRCKNCMNAYSSQWGKHRAKRSDSTKGKSRKRGLTNSVVAKRIGLSVSLIPDDLMNLSREYLLMRKGLRDLTKTLKDQRNGN